MDAALIENWNSVANKGDLVYCLGDFCWGKEERWIEILKQLNGQKFLILGNHDRIEKMSPKVKKYFADIKDYKEIKDNGRKVIMSHEGKPTYRKDHLPNVYHLYGHVHNTFEHELMEYFRKYIRENDKRESGRNLAQFYNCWCGFYGYKPVTLDQIIEYWETKEDN